MSDVPNMHPAFKGRYFPRDCRVCEPDTDLDARRKVVERDQERNLNVARAANWNPIPDLFSGAQADKPAADLATFTVTASNRDAYRAAHRLVRDMEAKPSGQSVRGFGMYGSKGGGKSRLSYAIVRRLRASGIAAVIYTLPALDRAVRESWGDKVRERELYTLLARAPLLVIDDLGKERKTSEDGQLGEFFFELIDERVLATLPVVVSTNFSPHDLEFSRYAGMDRFEAVLDRLNGIFGSEWVAVTGASYRE